MFGHIRQALNFVGAGEVGSEQFDTIHNENNFGSGNGHYSVGYLGMPGHGGGGRHGVSGSKAAPVGGGAGAFTSFGGGGGGGMGRGGGSGFNCNPFGCPAGF
eukprot:JP448504.1.p2 GENE.JP448504.1~~JP448504.1.p2  ORF type:complete len:102 (+),score=21.01 JP448504.1:26-331(+)